MSDFTLEPDEIEPEPPARSRPVRLVSTGLAPTAEVPSQRCTPEPLPCYGPCEACGGMVLVGRTPSGQRLALDTHVPTYLVVWEGRQPLLHGSRGYPVHSCQKKGGRDA